MKIALLAFAMLISFKVTAQINSLSSNVYNINTLDGSTTDLEKLKLHTSTLQPGRTNHPPRALNDVEELIIVQRGRLNAIINGSEKTLGPGSIILILAGDVQNFRNTSDSAVTYCVLSFKGRLAPDIARGREAGGSLMIDWNELIEKKTDKGFSRPVFDKATSMFKRMEIHVTALNTGFDSHAPHTHRAEEMMLLIKGNVTAQIEDKKIPASFGDVILITPDIQHNLKNTGSGQCAYYSIKWFNE
jgi:(S)-ureidoglycine aminohydrolase